MHTRSIRHALVDDLDNGFTLMVREHQPHVYSGAYRFTRDHDAARDVAQDTFERAYGALRGYDADRIMSMQLRPWLWTIALNLCRTRYRREPRTTELVEQGTVSQADAEPLDDDAWNARLARLSDTQRTAVVLRHVVDLPIAEISDITGRPEGTVKADISRGIARLRDSLTQEDTT